MYLITLTLSSCLGEGDEYIVEEREVEMARTCKSAQRIQMAILQDLRHSLGVDATLPEGAVKDLVLQVSS